MSRLQGKVALVTGASQGIGRAICMAFAKEGADIVANYLASDAAAKTLKQEIEKMGRKIQIIKADVTKKADVDFMVKEVIITFGHIDILVNNAGGSKGMPILDLNEETWDRIVDLNMKSVYLVSQAVARHMLARGTGVIINMSSVAGLKGATSTAPALHYNAAKQGVVAMTRTMANAFGPHVRANAIAPGVILTKFHEKAGGSDEAAKKRGLDCALKRAGTPEEIAKVAVFLASDDSSYMTGQLLVVDGGLDTLPHT